MSITFFVAASPRPTVKFRGCFERSPKLVRLGGSAYQRLRFRGLAPTLRISTAGVSESPLPRTSDGSVADFAEKLTKKTLTRLVQADYRLTTLSGDRSLCLPLLAFHFGIPSNRRRRSQEAQTTRCRRSRCPCFPDGCWSERPSQLFNVRSMTRQTSNRYS